MLRLANCSPCALIGVALCLPLLILPWLPMPSAAPIDHELDVAAQEDPLRGLWTRHDGRGEGEPLRFWYFHGDGKGLFRYGKVGLANTHSFDYAVERGALRSPAEGERFGVELRFRKRGDEHRLTAVLEREGGATYLRLLGDPYESGARYRKVESQLDFSALAHAPTPAHEPASAHEPAAVSGIGDRIWIDYRNFATGGGEFHMYQLGKTAIDGRGVGWFHRGDFDDWSTESLTYRIDGERLELFFDVREEPNVTTFHVRAAEGERVRELLLDADPRDYWATHRYRDGGRSFGHGAFDVVVGLERAVSSSATR